jgi:hypothetical protein
MTKHKHKKNIINTTNGFGIDNEIDNGINDTLSDKSSVSMSTETDNSIYDDQCSLKEGASSGELCPICCDFINRYDKNNNYTTQCDHNFHTKCIRKWYLTLYPRHRSCPVCQKRDKKKTIKFIIKHFRLKSTRSKHKFVF